MRLVVAAAAITAACGNGVTGEMRQDTTHIIAALRPRGRALRS